ncbi:hypothetical protein N7491_011355 [Penicillium cf. griseofulvum]|nr:hypothetical protein N7491_011355 [Penicillium cf. griseofulvum]
MHETKQGLVTPSPLHCHKEDDILRLNGFTNLLLWSSSVSADFFTAKSCEVGNNIDLGHLLSITDFHTAIGHSGTWEDITEYETFDEENGNQQEQILSPFAPVTTGLIRRMDYCSESTGITKMACLVGIGSGVRVVR